MQLSTSVLLAGDDGLEWGVNGKFRSVHSTFSAADFSTMKTSGQLSHTRDGLRALFDSR